MAKASVSASKNHESRHSSSVAGVSDRSTRWSTIAVCLLLLLGVVAVFGQTIHHEFFNLDDDIYVYKNPHVTQGLSGTSVSWALFHGYLSAWHPLTWLSLMADHEFYGLNAGGYHATNVLLHAAAALALFFVLRNATGRIWASGIATGLFAMHPLRVESVAWVIERKDVLSGLFFMLALLAYVAYTRHSFSWWRYLLVVALFAAGLMAKPMLVTFPVVLLLLDVWPLGRIGSGANAVPLKKLIIEKIPLLALAVAACLITLLVQEGNVFHHTRFSFLVRLENALDWYVYYLRQFFWPVNLAVLYEPTTEPAIWKPVASLLVLAGITVATFFLRHRHPCLLVGWLWYLVTLLPVIGLVPFGHEAVADRFTYLPYVGLCMALVFAAGDAAQSSLPKQRIAAALGVLAVFVLACCAWRQTTYWRNSETLWQHTIDCTAGNSEAHNALGNAMIDAGRTDKAIKQYRRAIKIYPGYAAAHFNLAAALASIGDVENALAEYQTAIALKPTDAKAQNNLGNLLLLQGRFDEGLPHCREAVRLAPDFAEAHYNLANTLFAMGHSKAAIAEYNRAIGLRPNYALAHYNLGLQLANLDRQVEAIAEYRTVIALDPKFAEAHYSLGLALKALGRRDEAKAEFHEALRLRPEYFDAQVQLQMLD